MPSAYESFWDHASFAVVGHSAAKGFPTLTYRGLKMHGKKLFAVDPSVADIEGDRTYPDLAALPEPVDAIVLEVPKAETEAWIQKASEAGIRNVWIHMTRETPEALALAERHGMNVLSGTCAVMYLTKGLTYHSVHKWLNQLLGKY